VLLPALALAAAVQAAAPPSPGLARPQRDPATVRGCVDGRRLRVVEHDLTDLSGVRHLRLKGSRALLQSLKDAGSGFFELSGQLELPNRDRVETQRKRRVGDRTTVSLGAAVEQQRGAPIGIADPEFVVEAFTRLDEACPGR
jgi:hypothetical protein